MAGAGRRFVLEAIFLACLAVAAGLADLSTSQIIGVMAIGWFLTVLIELVSWRLAVRHPAAVAVPQALAEPEPVVAEPEAEALPAPEAAAAEELPRKRRGLFRRGPREEEAPVEVDDGAEPPRHVRLIERGDEEDTGTHEAPPEQRAEGQ